MKAEWKLQDVNLGIRYGRNTSQLHRKLQQCISWIHGLFFNQIWSNQIIHFSVISHYSSDPKLLHGNLGFSKCYLVMGFYFSHFIKMILWVVILLSNKISSDWDVWYSIYISFYSRTYTLRTLLIKYVS